ncbi:PRC1 [Lepeophtheirus salmonis]|uniref:PRC1 n=1 Tax=Lepeophtheirus salmonis TaxID=72036 RepID=A0A7R8CE16_LEPSM|nr:PRC1 [Lepeophtheirus salmonis]CAF2791747.1 PRC1 [Lepeophtheirus salmonis]
MFSGYSRHNRSTCPARNAICKNCAKKCHYVKVYKSITSSKLITRSTSKRRRRRMDEKEKGFNLDLSDSFSSLSKESFIDSLSALSLEYGGSLWDLWVQMGCSSGSSGAYRVQVVHNCLEEKFKAMMQEEEGHRSALFKNIEEHYKKLYSLSKELGISLEEPPAALSIIFLEKDLRDKVENLLQKKKERLSQLTSYVKQDVKLGEMLAEEPYSITLHNIPSKEEELSLKKHVIYLTELKQERLSTFKAYKKSFADLLIKLDIEPANSFERAIFCETDESFLPLSEVRLCSVAKTIERLESQVQQNMRETERMRCRIRNVASKLELDEREISDFLHENPGFSSNELKALQFRLDELEVLKIEHMERFIVSFPKGITGMVEKELLTEHEEEIEKIRTYYYNNEFLFHMVEQRHALWEKKLELEKKAKDPNRFNCKSTKFLKEEKDRRRVEKDLPKIEKCLEDAMDDYRLENGIEFLIGGLPYQTYMEIQIKEHEDSIQREKVKKANAKKQLLIQESRYGSTPAKLNSTKRKAPNTSDNSVTKRYKSDVTRGTVNSTRSSTRSTLTRSTSTRCNSTRSNLSRRRNILQSSIVVGSSEFKMTLSSLGDKDPFLNPLAINANSTRQTEMTPHNIKQTPKTTLATRGRAFNRRSRSAVQLSSKKSLVINLLNLFSFPETSQGRLHISPDVTGLVCDGRTQVLRCLCNYPWMQFALLLAPIKRHILYINGCTKEGTSRYTKESWHIYNHNKDNAESNARPRHHNFLHIFASRWNVVQ